MRMLGATLYSSVCCMEGGTWNNFKDCRRVSGPVALSLVWCIRSCGPSYSAVAAVNSDGVWLQALSPRWGFLQEVEGSTVIYRSCAHVFSVWGFTKLGDPEYRPPKE